MKKEQIKCSSPIVCDKCKASLRGSALVKLKDRYCCPRCYATVLTKKEFIIRLNKVLDNSKEVSNGKN